MSLKTSLGGQSLLPDSRLGRLADELVNLINDEDQLALLEFVGSNLSEKALKQNGREKYLSILKKVQSQTNGVTIVDSKSTNNLLEVRLRSEKLGRLARLYMFPDKADPQKILDFGFISLADPLSYEEDTWVGSVKTEQEVSAEIKRHVDRLVGLDAFSGVVLVAKNERILYRRAYGFAEKSFQVPNRPDTKLNLGSMNKMFTSIATAQLVASGRLKFETKLEEVLPGYPNPTAASKIAIHHLLSHTAGLGMFFDSPLYNPRKRYRDHAELASVFASSPLAFEPGTRSSYSNEGFLVLGAVIEEISGQNYQDYVRDHIFHPAGMYDTDSYPLDEVVPNLAVGYMRYEDDPFGMEQRRPNFIFLGWRGNACGGGYSTAGDLLKFSQALRGYKLLDRELTETVTMKQGLMPGYGFGFEVRTINGCSVRGHSGGGANSGINSDFGIFWDKGYTVIVLSNYDAPVAQDLHRKICNFLSLQSL